MFTNSLRTYLYQYSHRQSKTLIIISNCRIRLMTYEKHGTIIKFEHIQIRSYYPADHGCYTLHLACMDFVIMLCMLLPKTFKPVQSRYARKMKLLGVVSYTTSVIPSFKRIGYQYQLIPTACVNYISF